ncbi:hypothetical protein [Methylobacterium sp. 10]|uniref:calcium-binding protein n=1 Tax=Methylobacterium sp. 10 TaxID=1101191 RepID=UPI0004B073BE|nr:hypothetical protein [Methylobacterium sp. 10]
MASALKGLGYFNDIKEVAGSALNLIGLIPGVEIPEELLAVFGGSNNDPSLELIKGMDSKLDVIEAQNRQVLAELGDINEELNKNVILDIKTESVNANNNLSLYNHNNSISTYRDAALNSSGLALTRAVVYAEDQNADIRIVVPALLSALTTRINVIRDIGDGATSGEFVDELRRAIVALDAEITPYREQANDTIRTYARVSVRNDSDVYVQIRYNDLLDINEGPVVNRDLTSQYTLYIGQNGSEEVKQMLQAVGLTSVGAGARIDNLDILNMDVLRNFYAHGEDTFMDKDHIIKSPPGWFDQQKNYVFNEFLNERSGVADMESAVNALRNVISGQHVIDRDGTYNGIIQASGVLPGSTAPNTLEGRAGDDQLIGNEGNDTLRGGDGNDRHHGNGGDDIILGGAGNDWLDGGAGDDRLDGGAGSDTASYASATSRVLVSLDLTNWQDTGFGKDRLISIENLEGSNFNDQLRGDAGNNTISGLAGNDFIKGGLGADRMIGGTGDDIYIVDNVKDTVVELAGEGVDIVNSSVNYTIAANIENLYLSDDAIKATGNASANHLRGNSANNILDGKAGADTMEGSDGSDTYYVDNVGDKIIEEDFYTDTDRVFASVSYSLGVAVENLTLTGTGDLKGTGNDLANVLTGNSGNNVLDGRGGADTMVGGAGSDTYIVDTIGDKAVELSGAAGTDLVKASVSFSLGGSYVENLTLIGTGNLGATGNSLDNVLRGNAGANVLDGKTGADTMIGGAGSDIYIVDNTGDKAVELSASVGTDLVKASVSFSLGGSYVENLTLTGTGNLSATGNTLANVLKGNAGANHLDGGLGADKLTGLAGQDTFVFSTKLGATNIDHITDFSAMDDTIQLSKSVFAALSAGDLAVTAFKDLGVTGAKIDGNDRIIYDHETGALSFDADGSGTAAKAIQFAVIDNHDKVTLTHLDFLVA